MPRRPGVSLVLLTICGLGTIASGQAPAASNPAPATAILAAPIFFGQSVVPLYGPWKFQIGDSPSDLKTGEPLWAEPGFDDSQWESVDLTPGAGRFNPARPDAPQVPGWRA